MAGKNLLSVIFLVLLMLASVNVVSAQTVPSFPSCVNPQGTLKVSYASGIHGIPGDTNVYSGSDSVYILTDDTLFQCFCPSNGGTGIQTNWWKVSNLSQVEIQVLVQQGWIFVPNGSAWGLDAAPYLARNSNFACFPGIGGPDVLGTSKGDVLGLATTGNSAFIISVILSGLTLIGFGALTNKKGK